LVFEHWHLIEPDLHSEYGIDTASGILTDRSWKWLRTRVLGLLTCESRIQRKLSPPPEAPKVPSVPRR